MDTMLQNYGILFELMDLLGKKWIIPLLIFLFLFKQNTFSKLKKNLRITSRELSKKLKLLEALGMVERVILNDSRNVFYKLSHNGKNVSELLLGIAANLRQ